MDDRLSLRVLTLMHAQGWIRTQDLEKSFFVEPVAHQAFVIFLLNKIKLASPFLN